MKRNKVDSIGYGNGKGIGLGRNLVGIGMFSIAIGWAILNKNSDWCKAINENGKESAKLIYDTFSPLKKMDN